MKKEDGKFLDGNFWFRVFLRFSKYTVMYIGAGLLFLGCILFFAYYPLTVVLCILAAVLIWVLADIWATAYNEIRKGE